MTARASYKHYFSIYANFRDEAPYLYEWIVYHLLIGVDHFYLYNHFSKDGFLEVLQPFIDRGIVTLNHITNSKTSQPKFIGTRECIQNYKNESQWIAFIDLDEFITLPDETSNIRLIMEPYESYNGIGMAWIFYGANGHLTQPDSLVLESYTKRQLFLSEGGVRHPWYKTIANPRKVNENNICNPHFLLYKDQNKTRFATVDENFKKIGQNQKGRTEELENPSYKKIYVSHFFTKSLEEFVFRKGVLPSDVGPSGRPYITADAPMEKRQEEATKTWRSYQNRDNIVEDKVLYKFVDKIKRYKLDE